MESPRTRKPRTSPRTSSTDSPAAKPRSAAPRRAGAAALDVSHEAIARRAYDLYLGSGGGHGRDVEFWLTAERELKRRRKA